ncbi:hypothetical protein F2Q69_00021387 [Brassica cretica]|uniref:Uncharacterized protein n=1 Tax=Brassica cretica TaxID=69181 RepID=A0A8S9Q2Q2_BRACR|nr:hypothetical protein F2Q69_00021387 [Brassica cretica]
MVPVTKVGPWVSTTGPWKVFGFIAASFSGDCLRTLHEHDVLMCFSEHGGTLLMSWRSWPEPNFALAAVELMSSGDGRLGPPSLESTITAYLERVFSKKFDDIQSMVTRLLGVAPPIRISKTNSYADTPFTDEIALFEMPQNFFFPNMSMYDGTGDPDNHVTQYKQQILTVAIQRELREATMCKGFGSAIIGPDLQWYINLPNGSIRSFATLTDKYVEQFASSRSLEKTSEDLYEILQDRSEPLWTCSDGELYKELTKYQCKTMDDVLYRAWAHVKWEEDITSRAKAQQKQDQKVSKQAKTDRDEGSHQRKEAGRRNRGMYQNSPLEKAEGMNVSMWPSSTWPDISHLAISKPELIKILRQMGPQVKWPQKMKAPDSFWNPNRRCDFQNDHSHKT